MALGEITKQLAKQALGNQVNEMLEGSKPAEPPKPGAPGQVMIGQIQAMQRALKEDQELAVFFNTGSEMLRVLEIYVPSWQVFVLTGTDPSRMVTRVVAAADSVQLVCKVMKATQGATPSRINFITPK